MRPILLILMLAVVCALGGCSKPATPPEATFSSPSPGASSLSTEAASDSEPVTASTLAGEWVAVGDRVLRLNEDGGYEQSVDDPALPGLAPTGQWEVTSDGLAIMIGDSVRAPERFTLYWSPGQGLDEFALTRVRDDEPINMFHRRR